MANPGSINWNGYMLPAGLRDLLGIPAPEPQPVATPADVLAPPPVVQPPPAPPVQNAPDFAIAPPVEPKYGKQLAASNKAAAKSQAQQDAAAASQGFRMPTLAQAVGEQQAATEDQARAVAGETAVAAKTADDVYAAQLDAQRKLEENDAALKAQQEQSDRIRADKQMAADALMAQADATKVDMGRYWSDANTGKKVGWLISMAMSGLGDVLAGKSGPNPVIAMLEQTIDKDVRQQEMNRVAIKERAQRASDAVDAFDRFSASQEARILARRAQAKELVAQQLAVATAKHGGEAAIANGQKNIALIRKSGADDLIKANDMAHGHAMQEEQARNARAQVGLGYARLAQDKQQFGWQQQMDVARLQQEADKLAASGNAAAAKAVKEGGIGGVAKTVQNADGSYSTTYDLLRNKDQTVFTAPTEKEAQELRSQKAAVDSINQFVNDMTRGIKSHGGESAFFKSADWQRMQSQKAFVLNNLRTANAMGTLDKGAMEVTEMMLGAADPTSYWQDASAGLLAGRDATNAQFNAKIRAMGYTGEDYRPVDTSTEAAGAFKSEEDQLKQYLGSSGVYDSNDSSAAASPHQMAVLYGQIAIMNNRNGDRAEQARRIVADMAENALSPQVRDTAKQAILALGIRGNTSESPSVSGRSVARDSVSAPRAQPKPKAPEKPVRRDSAGNPL